MELSKATTEAIRVHGPSTSRLATVRGSCSASPRASLGPPRSWVLGGGVGLGAVGAGVARSMAAGHSNSDASACSYRLASVLLCTKASACISPPQRPPLDDDQNRARRRAGFRFARRKLACGRFRPRVPRLVRSRSHGGVVRPLLQSFAKRRPARTLSEAGLASMLHSRRTSASAGGAGGLTPPCTTRRWSMSTSHVCSGG
jgi:hypothetical protein